MIESQTTSPGDTKGEDLGGAPQRLPVRLRVKAAAKALLVTVLLALFLKMFVVEAYRIPSGSMENTLLVGDFLLVNKLAYGIRTPRYFPMTTKAIPSITFPSFGSVGRGDVLVFEYPGKRDAIVNQGPVYFIKRCIGLPGDTVAVKEGRVFVNGQEVVPPVHAKEPEWGVMNRRDDYGPAVVPRRGETIYFTAENAQQWKEFLEREHHSVEVDPEGTIRIDGAERREYRVERDYYFVLGDNRGNSLDSRVWGFVPENTVVGEALLVYWSWNPGVVEDDLHGKQSAVRWNRIGKLIR